MEDNNIYYGEIIAQIIKKEKFNPSGNLFDLEPIVKEEIKEKLVYSLGDDNFIKQRIALKNKVELENMKLKFSEDRQVIGTKNPPFNGVYTEVKLRNEDEVHKEWYNKM